MSDPDTAPPSSSAASVAPLPSPSTGSKARGGGVGAGLATATWWEHYYQQCHEEYWDWYLPNEVVLRYLREEALRMCGWNGDDEEGEEQSGSASPTVHPPSATSSAPAAAPPSPSPSPLPPALLIPPRFLPRFSKLSWLQLGCGNSSITADLWCMGVRRMHNVDFSHECIERMRKMQGEKGWIHTAEEEALEDDEGTAVAAASPSSTSPSLTSSPFSFHVMDVRTLSYPSSSFSLVFDKGTLDCVVLESADSVASAQRTLNEVYRVLKTGGVYLCFSLYPPTARANFFINVLTEEEGGESEAEKQELLDVLDTPNPPSTLRTEAWSLLRMIRLEQSPLEFPSQEFTYLYIATKR